MGGPEQEVVEHKVRRAVGINALRKIVADGEKAGALRWFASATAGSF